VDCSTERHFDLMVYLCSPECPAAKKGGESGIDLTKTGTVLRAICRKGRRKFLFPDPGSAARGNSLQYMCSHDITYKWIVSLDLTTAATNVTEGFSVAQWVTSTSV
jgi:hypothetical protein